MTHPINNPSTKTVKIQCSCGAWYPVQIPLDSQLLVVNNPFINSGVSYPPYWKEKSFIGPDGREGCTRCKRKLFYGWSKGNNIGFYTHRHPLEKIIQKLSRNSWGVAIIGSFILTCIIFSIASAVLLISNALKIVEAPPIIYAQPNAFSLIVISIYLVGYSTLFFVLFRGFTRNRYFLGQFEALTKNKTYRAKIVNAANLLFSSKVFYIGNMFLLPVIIATYYYGYPLTLKSDLWYMPGDKAWLVGLISFLPYVPLEASAIQYFGGIIAVAFNTFLYPGPVIDITDTKSLPITKSFFDYLDNSVRILLAVWLLFFLLPTPLINIYTGQDFVAILYQSFPAFSLWTLCTVFSFVAIIYVRKIVLSKFNGDGPGPEPSDYMLLCIQPNQEKTSVEARGPLVGDHVITSEIKTASSSTSNIWSDMDNRYAKMIGIANRLLATTRGEKDVLKSGQEEPIDLMQRFDVDMQKLGEQMYNDFIFDRDIHSMMKDCIKHSIPVYIYARGAAETVPWELMHDGQDFLCLHTQVNRIVTGSPPIHSGHPIKSVLIVGATPDPQLDLDPLDLVEKECELIKKALHGIVHVDVISGKEATIANVTRALQTKEYDALHFSGHSCMVDNPLFNYLAFADGKFTAKDLERMIRFNKLNLQLIFLNSCNSTRSKIRPDDTTRIGGFAHSLISVGVPCVVGMQWAVTEPGAEKFAKYFYSYVSEGKSPGEAVWDARRKMAEDVKANDMTWAAPMIFIK